MDYMTNDGTSRVDVDTDVTNIEGNTIKINPNKLLFGLSQDHNVPESVVFHSTHTLSCCDCVAELVVSF